MASRLIRIVLGCLAVLILLQLLVLAFAIRADNRASEAASEFCRLVQVGKSVDSLIRKANDSGIELTTWEAPELDLDTATWQYNGTVRHQAMFSGFLANMFECDVRSRNGLVISAVFVNHSW